MNASPFGAILAFGMGWGLSTWLWQADHAGTTAVAAVTVDSPSRPVTPGRRESQSEVGPVPDLGVTGKPSLERRLRDLLRRPSDEATGVGMEGWTVEEFHEAAALMVARRHELLFEDVIRAGHWFVAAWAGKEPEAALAWVNHFPDMEIGQRNSWKGQVFGVMAKSDPEAVFRRLAEESNPFLRAEITEASLGSWARSSPEEAIGWFGQHPELLMHADAFATQDEKLFGKRWAAMLKLPSGPVATALKKSLASQMTLESLEDYQSFHGSTGLLLPFRLSSRGSPELGRKLWDAVQTAEDLTVEHELALVHEGLAGMMKGDDPTSAVAMLSQPHTQSQRRALLDRLAALLSKDKSPKSRRESVEQIENVGVRAEVVSEAIAVLTDDSKDYIEAAELLRSQPVAGLRSASAMKVGYRWRDADVGAALQWVQKLPAGQDREWALTGLVAHAASEDISAAQNVMRLIQSNEARLAARKTIAARWLQQNPSAARPWMDAQRFSPNDVVDIRDAAALGSSDGAFRPDGKWTTKL